MTDGTMNVKGGTIALKDQGDGTWALAVEVVGGQKGAANVAVSQVAASTSATQLVAARPTRRGVTIRNFDNSISVYIGPATVSAANGMLLKGGESIYVDWVGLIQVIAASGTPTVGVWDAYD